MAVIVVLALVSIVMIYLAFNLRTLASLGRELRLVERQQIGRLKTVNSSRINKPPAAVVAPAQ